MNIGRLWPFTQQVLASLANSNAICRIEPHDQEDPEGGELLWYIETPDHTFCKGRYVAISPEVEGADYYSASFNERILVGGDPTGESFIGLRCIDKDVGMLCGLISTFHAQEVAYEAAARRNDTKA